MPNPIFGGNQYKQKDLIHWSNVDVFDWLSELSLPEYASTFYDHGILGTHLTKLTRAEFIKMNITKISHRKLIEDSIRDYSNKD